jgi:hypothetical protein
MIPEKSNFHRWETQNLEKMQNLIPGLARHDKTSMQCPVQDYFIPVQSLLLPVQHIVFAERG